MSQLFGFFYVVGMTFLYVVVLFVFTSYCCIFWHCGVTTHKHYNAHQLNTTPYHQSPLQHEHTSPRTLYCLFYVRCSVCVFFFLHYIDTTNAHDNVTQSTIQRDTTQHYTVTQQTLHRNHHNYIHLFTLYFWYVLCCCVYFVLPGVVLHFHNTTYTPHTHYNVQHNRQYNTTTP